MRRGAVGVVNHFMFESQGGDQRVERDPLTAFELLGFPPRYALDLGELENHYRRVQSSVHPDRFVGKSTQDQIIAAGYAVKLSEAYQTLKDPVKRAAELLKAKGTPVPGDNGQTVQHPTLLMDMIQGREDLEACETEKELMIFEKKLSERLDAVKTAFDSSPDALSSLYLEFVYLRKILEEINSHPLRRAHVHPTR
jgi:molecular chaperone HscB